MRSEIPGWARRTAWASRLARTALTVGTTPSTTWPEGAPDKEVRIRVDAEGVYLYVCAAHRMMGMVGVILVGNPVNLEDARRVAKQETSKFVLNKDRFDKALAQID